MREVLDIAEAFQAEGVAITQLDRLNRGYRCVIDDESLPLPRCRGESEQVTNQHAVGTSVSKKCESLPRFIDMPNRQFGL